MRTPDRAANEDYSRGRGPLRGRENAAAEPSEGPAGDPPAPARGGGPQRAPRTGARWPSDPLARRRAAALFAVAGLIGAVALGLADLNTLYRVSVGATVRQTIAGHDRHAYALVVVAVAAAALLLPAARGSEPAALAVAALGLLALVVGPVSDRNAVGSTGVIGRLYDNATAQSGAGYHLELAGSVLLLLAGGALLGIAAPGLLGRLTRGRGPGPRGDRRGSGTRRRR